ncbi:MAG: hypothetical protein NVSMB1_16480 [Polyangiales bacterium]
MSTHCGLPSHARFVRQLSIRSLITLLPLAGIVATPARVIASGDAVMAPSPKVPNSASTEGTAGQSAIIGPVLTPIGGSDKEPAHRIAGTDALTLRAREIQLALKDAATDLGLAIDLTAQIPSDGARELEMVKRASVGAWVISPRIEAHGGDSFTLRMVAVSPKSNTLLVRVEKIEGPRLTARAVVMLRDFVTMKIGAATVAQSSEEMVLRPDERERSRGRPILAASTSLFGLYAAFSIYKSAGSDDPRLLYPLLALGAGTGLGAALLVSDEFDVTPGTAWTAVGGTWWGVIAGLNIAAGRSVQPLDDRYAWGLGGGLIGTTFAAVALAAARFDDGDAALVHSGAAFGTFGGGALEYLIRGDLRGESPSSGIGYGAGAGLLTGGLLGALVTTSAQRVMMIDLGAGLGALGAASVASPLVVGKETSLTKTRLFLSAVLTGTAIGGVLGFIATRERDRGTDEKRATASNSSRGSIFPTAGVMGLSVHPQGGAVAPIFGAGVFGSF